MIELHTWLDHLMPRQDFLTVFTPAVVPYSVKEVVTMKKYILRILFFTIVFLIVFTIKVK